MAIHNAMNLIRDAKKNPALRMKLNDLPFNEMEEFLIDAGYGFTLADFEEAVNMLHVKCQTYEEADELMQVSMWLKLLLGVQA